MRIRLIQPAQLDENGNRIRYKQLFLPFLSMTTLAGLTPAGVDVDITEDFVEEIDFDENIDLVGITAHTSQAPRAYQIADEFRRRGRKVILGGIHPSVCPDEARKHADSVLIGEAEDLWTKVIDDAKNGSLCGIYRSERMSDLTRLVIPRFDLLDLDHYVSSPFEKRPVLPFQTSRGCPNHCDFCSVTGFLGHRVRTKPIANVIEEIERSDPSRIFFVDDNIAGDPTHAEELFKALKPLKLRWSCQMSTQIGRRPDLIELAAEAGCHACFMGIETINEDSLSSVNKGFNKADEYEAVFKQLKEVGILPEISLMIGFDGDTVDSLRRTIDSVLKWDITYMYMFVLTPLPSTKFYRVMKEQGRIHVEDWSAYDCAHPVCDHPSLTADQLVSFLWESYREFYSVGNILKRIWRFRKPYLLHFPRNIAIEDLFFSFHTRNAVRHRVHPLAPGIRDVDQ